MNDTLGTRFAHALGHKDSVALKELLAADVDFRAMTPGRIWESSTASDVVDATLLGSWFAPDEHITAIDRIESGTVGARHRVGYQFAVTNLDGDFVVEQQAYFDVDPTSEKISWLRIICSGFQASSPN